MQDDVRLALIRLALHAALADGIASPAERNALEQLRSASPTPLPALDQILASIQNRRLAVRELTAGFIDDTSRQEAWSTCLAVCEADGAPSAAERWFLDEVRAALQLSPASASAAESSAAAIADTVPPAFTTSAPPAPVQSTLTPDANALEKTILKHALFAGGLELLPDTLATMTILPVQIRLVYEVGKAHGIQLDRGHIMEFLGVVGIGVASQVVERYATRWLSGLAGKFLGGIGRSIVSQATSSGMSFATTYALGQLSRQYYAGGRRLGAVELRSLFDRLLSDGRRLQQQYLPQIQQQGASLRGANLAQLIRAI